MAFQSGQSTSIQDLMDQLSTFAQAEGWTQDHAAAGRLFLSKDGVFVSFRWDTSAPTVIGIYQALAFSGSGVDPGNHTNDSGQGVISGTNATIATGRRCELSNTTASYQFFLGDVDGQDYIYVFQENGSGIWVSFGFGELVKYGTWTGGEFAFGWRHNIAAATSGQATRIDTSMLLDGLADASAGASTIRPYIATIHTEGLPNQIASSEWSVVSGSVTNMGNDRSGGGRNAVVGGYRGSFLATEFGRFSGTAAVGLVPMYTIHLWYRDPTLVRYYPLGYMPDIRGIHVGAYVAGQEITVGGDTWVVFPSRTKSGAGGSAAGATHYQGIAVKKVA